MEEIEKAERQKSEKIKQEEEKRKSQLNYNSVVDELKKVQISKNMKTQNSELNNVGSSCLISEEIKYITKECRIEM